MGRDLGAFSSAVYRALGDLPAEVWNNNTLVAASLGFEWWPSLAEMDKLLRPIGRKIAAERDALRRIAQSAVAPPAPAQAQDDAPITPDYAAQVLRKWGYRSVLDAPAPASNVAATGPTVGRARTAEQIARSTMQVADFRAQLRAKYAEDAASTNPQVAEGGRKALAAMDHAASAKE